MSFLAIDVGNTRLKWAQYASPQPGAGLIAHGAVFLETIDTLADTDWKGLAPPASMLGCVVAGEGVKRRVEEQLELWDVEPRWVVASEAEAGLTNGYDFPARLGADLLVFVEIRLVRTSKDVFQAFKQAVVELPQVLECHLVSGDFDYLIKARVADILDRFQIVGKKDLFPNQLSGGQQQLVAVARAVISRPALLLADEPTGALHSSQGKMIMDTLKQLNDEGTTIVQVTHSEANAEYGNRVVELFDGWMKEAARA